MKPGKVKALVDQLWRDIALNAAAINAGFDEGHIHRFRTGVKKLRALLRLLKSMGHSYGKVPGYLLHLYHIAGHIREAQLDTARIAALGLPIPSSFFRLERLSYQFMNQWLASYDAARFSHAGAKLLEYKFSHVKPANIRDFADEKLRCITDLLAQPHLTNEDMHTLRKHVKDMLYVARLTGGKKKRKEVMDIPVLESLASQLGHWNELRMLILRMRSFRHTCPPDEEKILMHLLPGYTTKLKKDKADLRTLVTELLPLTAPH